MSNKSIEEKPSNISKNLDTVDNPTSTFKISIPLPLDQFSPKKEKRKRKKKAIDDYVVLF